MITLDQTDREMLKLLRHDARQPISSLAAALGVSRITAKTRLDRLLATGAIQRFTIQTPAFDDDTTIRAITLIEVQGLRSESVQSHLRKMPEITSVFTTNGVWSLVAHSETRTLADFDDTLTRITRIPGVTSTETCLLLNQVI